jgi:hypothetical protein
MRFGLNVGLQQSDGCLTISEDLICNTCMENWVGNEEIGITKKRQAIYVQRNIEARVRNHC